MKVIYKLDGITKGCKKSSLVHLFRFSYSLETPKYIAKLCIIQLITKLIEAKIKKCYCTSQRIRKSNELLTSANLCIPHLVDLSKHAAHFSIKRTKKMPWFDKEHMNKAKANNESIIESILTKPHKYKNSKLSRRMPISTMKWWINMDYWFAHLHGQQIRIY